MPSTPTAARVRVDAHESFPLSDGWTAARGAPDRCSGLDSLDALDWLPARVPGTAAGVLRDAGQWSPGETHDFDTEDWCFRTTFTAEPLTPGEEAILCLDGLATVAEVYLNGECILESESMFAAHAIDVGALLGETNELAIRFRALGPLLEPRRRPRARWRTRLVSNGNLRFFRTMLLGRAPGFAPGPACVGPWREVRLERRRILTVDSLYLRSTLTEGDGVLKVRARLRALDETFHLESVELELTGPSGRDRAPSRCSAFLDLTPDGTGAIVEGEVRAPGVARWWPHTHGEPALHDVRLRVTSGSAVSVLEAGRVGFRDLAFGDTPGHDVEADGLDLHVNGVRIFARGAVWTPIDIVGLTPSPAELRTALEQVRDAGMNMLRVVGTGAYEADAFHDLCDELGILVWQDFMFANFDYPIADETFRATVEHEAVQELDRVAGRPSLVVLCGNSEVEQQAAMLGRDPSIGRGELFGEILPARVRDSGADAIYLPSAPCGGELPFRNNRGVANYFGVGGYRRPLEDARRAEVRFASECLAFSNVPDEQAVEAMLPAAPSHLVTHHPRWKAGIPRDAGVGWDFEDVRDHYLGLVFGVDPAELRRVDHERYLELSRAVTGEVMAEVFGEWRRAASPCGGALVLWLRDLAPGAGWGVIDHGGATKVAYHHLRRALAPVALWTTDEGLGGIHAHVANDLPTPLRARLRVAMYRDLEYRTEEAQEIIELGPHSSQQRDLEALLGHFVDASWAYRFGPPGQDVIVTSLERAAEDSTLAGPGQAAGSEVISQSVRFPAGRPLTVEPSERLGLNATASVQSDGTVHLEVSTRRLAYGVRIHAPGFSAADNAFSVEPGGVRSIDLRPQRPGVTFAEATITALNLQGRQRITTGEPTS